MNFWVGIADFNWYSFHAAKEFVEEVNFWSPSARTFKAIGWGQPFLFKLKGKPYIGGGGFFTKSFQLPLSLAWETFGEANGAATYPEFQRLIRANRNDKEFQEDPVIGCTILVEPFFFDENDWIHFRLPAGIQTGKRFDSSELEGKALWARVQMRLAETERKIFGPATIAAQEAGRFGKPTLVSPRLGQGSFRLLITDAYQRRCAMTGERTLPALEAAHIHRYSSGGEHLISNGLLLRSDLHRLFDRGYITVDAENLTIVVSPRIKEEYENGRAYYVLHGQRLAQPVNPLAVPSREKLLYHSEHIFRS